jgi:hypothetical protein
MDAVNHGPVPRRNIAGPCAAEHAGYQRHHAQFEVDRDAPEEGADLLIGEDGARLLDLALRAAQGGQVDADRHVVLEELIIHSKREKAPQSAEHFTEGPALQPLGDGCVAHGLDVGCTDVGERHRTEGGHNVVDEVFPVAIREPLALRGRVVRDRVRRAGDDDCGLCPSPGVDLLNEPGEPSLRGRLVGGVERVPLPAGGLALAAHRDPRVPDAFTKLFGSRARSRHVIVSRNAAREGRRHDGPTPSLAW